ncbi:hypothetical protein N8017_00140 [Crocinitomicaceae bacterium]|nr:hypothetical protein [Crocinitomicaceae bacterium]MDC1361909.1 hypothetical protein [Crocinitomicaceae bacterium]
MRIIKLLVLFISISINGISQIDQLNENQVINIEQSSQNELDGLNNLLHLSPEQKEQIFDIIHGVLIKNKQVQSMKLIAADKKDILTRNNNAKIDMIKNVLIGKQKPLYTQYLANQITTKGLED